MDQERTGSTFKGNHIAVVWCEASSELKVFTRFRGPRYHGLAPEIESECRLFIVHGPSLLERVDVEERQSYPAGAGRPSLGETHVWCAISRELPLHAWLQPQAWTGHEALMPGYMTERQAKVNGFTHHGSYYGIPVWIGDPHGEFRVATKWAPLECVMTTAQAIEGFLLETFYPDDEPAFRFVVKRAI